MDWSRLCKVSGQAKMLGSLFNRQWVVIEGFWAGECLHRSNVLETCWKIARIQLMPYAMVLREELWDFREGSKECPHL